MTTMTIDIPDGLLVLLKHSRLGERSQADQVKTALAIQLCQEGGRFRRQGRGVDWRVADSI